MRKLVVSLWMLSLSAVPAAAPALPLLVPEGTSMRLERVDFVAPPAEANRTVWVEQLTLKGDAPRFALLQVFREAPSTIKPAVPELFGVLEDATKVEPPFHLGLKRRLFGPSVLTAILDRVGTTDGTKAPDEPVEAAPEAPRVAFETIGIQSFRGPITTSTITGERFLPADLEAWLAGTGTLLPRPAKDALINALASGATVVGMRIERPAGGESFTVGPIRYELSSKTTPAIIALTSSHPSAPPLVRTWGLDPRAAVAPVTKDPVFNEAPWDGPIGAGLNVTFFGAAIPELQESLEDRFALTSSASKVTRSEFRTLLGGDLNLGPVKGAIEIPGKSGKGSSPDIFLCLLLGLAPLLYAPESWLLLWITANAKERLRRGQSLGLVGAFWPLYALLVAGYWAYMQNDIGRTAAIGPLLVGLYRLLFPPRDDRGRPVRVDFSRKKRAGLKTRPPAKAKPD